MPSGQEGVGVKQHRVFSSIQNVSSIIENDQRKETSPPIKSAAEHASVNSNYNDFRGSNRKKRNQGR
jgi:hypothetical protein